VHYIDPISQPDFPQPSPLDSATTQSVTGNGGAVDLVDVLLIALVAFFSLVGCTVAGLTVYWFQHRALHLSSEGLSKAFAHDTLYLVLVQLAAYLVVIGFMALLTWSRHHLPLPQAISWSAPSRQRVFSAVALGVGLAFVSDIGNVVLNRWIPKSLPITEMFKDRSSAFLLAGFGILVAPLVEEMLFRGFLYPALARFTGMLPSIVVTASLFTLLHGAQLSFSWAPLLLIFIVGLALTIVRAATRSVAMSVVVHVTYNFMLLAQTFVVTHGFRQM